MQNKFFILWICFLAPFITTAQDTLKGNYQKLHLEAKNYYFSEVVTISDSLVIDAGAHLVLGNGVSVICRGAVAVNGSAVKRVYIQSAAGQNAQGFVFAAYSPTNISICYTRIEQLLLPLNFEYGWYRLAANIHNNEFIKNTGSIAIIQVLNPVRSLDNRKTPAVFTLENNLFAENIAPVYFEDFSGDVMKIKIAANVFTANTAKDYGAYTFSSNFLYGRMDNKQADYTAEITQNSFANNALWNNKGDSVLHDANMGVYGNADSIYIPRNYWGQGEESLLRKNIYDYTFNYTAPKLAIVPFLKLPGDYLPPHIYKATRLKVRDAQQRNYLRSNGRPKMLADTIGTAVDDNFDLRTGMQSLQLVLNTMPVSRSANIHFIYLKDSLNVVDTLLTGKIDTTQGAGSLVFEFDFISDSLFRTKPGYLQVDELTGKQGEYIAAAKIGYPVFIRLLNEKKLAYELKRKKYDSTASLVKPPVPIIINTAFKKKYEFGLMGAYALYFGTLSNKALFKNDFNSFIGAQFRYSVKKHMSVSVSLMKLTLTGSDLNSEDSTKIKRGLSFKTPVTNISLQFEYDFLDNSVYSTRNRIRPSIGFGVDYMKFAPTADYLGTTYDLHSIGTGGQYLPGAVNAPYSLTSFGAPITVQLRYFLSKKMIYTLFASYHLAFTDYLDDVGPDEYADPAGIAAANPSIVDAAVYLSNPTKRVVNKNTLRSGIASGSDSFFTFGFTLAYHF